MFLQAYLWLSSQPNKICPLWNSWYECAFYSTLLFPRNSVPQATAMEFMKFRLWTLKRAGCSLSKTPVLLPAKCESFWSRECSEIQFEVERLKFSVWNSAPKIQRANKHCSRLISSVGYILLVTDSPKESVCYTSIRHKALWVLSTRLFRAKVLSVSELHNEKLE